MGARPGTMNINLHENFMMSDRAPLERILRECAFFRDDEIPVALELIDDRLAKGEGSDYKFIVATHGDRPVGYVCYGRIACTVHSYDIYWIAVDPQVQRAGIGRRLMAAAEERIRDGAGQRVYVETSGKPQYESTRAFYLRCGYTVEAVLKEFYAPGDDKVILAKLLDPLPETAPGQ